MLCNLQRKNFGKPFLVGSAMLVASLGFYSCSDDALDRENDQPDGLNSLYGYVEDAGNFTNFVQLIQDLGEKDVLSKTGSKTLFVADDAAFDEFYKSNPWGVRSYSDLTMAQKKLLLYSAMIDNPYPTTLLSSAQPGSTTGGPVPGEVFRRVSSQSVLDSVAVIPASQFATALPKNKYFDAITSLDTIVLFEDATAHPMVHFNGKFLAGNRLNTTDIDFLYRNPAGTFKTEDVYVNNARVKVEEGKANIFCLNGFIHEVDKVILPLDNMAQIIGSDSRSTYFNSILDRFAAPQDSAEVTRAYTGNSRAENVFVKRYFSQRSFGSTVSAGSRTDVAYTTDKDGNTFDATKNLLKFDPGWNAFVSEAANPRTAMMEDMAVMFVPTDAAMETWWNEGGGKVIKDYYAKYATGSDMISQLNAVPTSVMVQLVNVNMFPTFVGTLPTNFGDVLDDANEKIQTKVSNIIDHIDDVKLGCNGAVYFTDSVYAPKSFQSVLFPVVIDTTQMKIMHDVILAMDYDKYLNSMVARYRFVIPTNKALLSYVDPVSYGQEKRNLWQIHIDDATKGLVADVYECTVNPDGTATPDKLIKTITGGVNNTYILNRMYDILDNTIVVGEAIPGKKYYKTKGNNYIKFEGSDIDNPDNPSGTEIQATWDVEHGSKIVPHQIFRMNNGVAYVADGMANGTTNSVSRLLNENPDFSDFLRLLQSCGAVSTNDPKDSWYAADQQFGNLLYYKELDNKKSSVTYLLNNYHYTVYAPTNDAMAQAFADGLPTFEMLEAAETADAAENVTVRQDSIKSVWLDFAKYHIQDNSIFIDEGFEDGNYESGKTKLHIAVDLETGEPNGKYTPGSPYTINVKSDANGITLVDATGRTANVLKKDGYYNLMAREWWLIDENNKKNIKNPYECKINNSSFAVVQAIDKPLYFNFKKGSTDPDENQFIYKDRQLSAAGAHEKNSTPRK